MLRLGLQKFFPSIMLLLMRFLLPLIILNTDRQLPYRYVPQRDFIHRNCGLVIQNLPAATPMMDTASSGKNLEFFVEPFLR
jgi:hypothetical protein